MLERCKPLWGLMLASVLSLSLLAGCNNHSNDTQTPQSDLPTAEDGTALTLGYKAGQDTVTFFFDETLQKSALDAKKVTAITGIGIRGSFNGWPNPTPADFMLKPSSTNPGIWYLQLPKDKVNIPGNSGHPEFQFVVNGTADGKTDQAVFMGIPASVPLGYWFPGNQLLVFAEDDVNTIVQNTITATTIKTINDFNLATPLGREKISNFRQVPGLSKLFRSYHPFKKSRNTFDSEDERVAQVNALMQEHGIKSDITLYKDETTTLDATKNESISAYYQGILNANSVYFIPDADYNTVYYASADSKFGNWIKGTVEFINDPAHEAPMSIHCRLGTDRTGVFTAVLAAMGGASWEEIKADYQRSNDMGIKEYRDYKLLQYSLQKMLGVSDITTVTDLKAAVSQHFIDGGYLTQAQIDTLVAKLK